MAFGKKQKQDKNKIFVEVLQNGQLLSETSRPYKSIGSVVLTAKPKGELTAPFYPLATDVEILKITKRGVEVDLDPNWEGFTTFEGRIEEINSDKKTDYIHIMKPGDYGSIAYNDLRVLIRIGKERKKRERQFQQSKEYKGKLGGIWFSNKSEIKYLSIGLLASFWLIGAVVIGLMYRPDTRPKSMADLKEVYTLPFIHHKHLEYLPEALQESLDRTNLVSLSFSYYSDMAKVLMGYTTSSNTSVFSSSRKRFASLHQKQDERVNEVIQDNKRIMNQGKRDTNQIFLTIPAIVGDSLDLKIASIIGTIKTYQSGLEKNLLNRINSSKQFHRDGKYVFEQYQAVTRFDQPRVFEPWRLTKDEKAMYDEAKELSLKARAHQRIMDKFSLKHDEINREDLRPVVIPKNTKQVRFWTSNNLANLDIDFERIQASQFDLRKSGLIKEPLVGQINPNLIKKTIQRNRFELQLCFELALRRNQGLQGKMEWQWRLDSRGKISELELLNSSINDRKMIRCVRKRIANWRFPRPKRGSVEIKYPFFFSPAKG
ncbi:MAG: AgmX/PglI C-terminal domain-containing protein [Pseudobacteriovorax sp.]|nr:AgmX/PglI C-terminal domain-containing protein [Pseudobacteriovorax sp.]